MAHATPPMPDAESWSQYFTAEQHKEQIEDDRHAWQAITGILLGILAIGLLLGVTAVTIVLSVGK